MRIFSITSNETYFYMKFNCALACAAMTILMIPQSARADVSVYSTGSIISTSTGVVASGSPFTSLVTTFRGANAVGYSTWTLQDYSNVFKYTSGVGYIGAYVIIPRFSFSVPFQSPAGSAAAPAVPPSVSNTTIIDVVTAFNFSGGVMQLRDIWLGGQGAHEAGINIYVSGPSGMVFNTDTDAPLSPGAYATWADRDLTLPPGRYTFRRTYQQTNYDAATKRTFTWSGGIGIYQGLPAAAPLISPQTITFQNPGTRFFGDADFVLSASSSSGLTVTYSVLSGPATISGATLSLSGLGSVTVRASQAGNAAFLSAPPVDQTFSVIKKTQAIAFPIPTTPVFTGTPIVIELAATSSSGLPITYSNLTGPATLSGNTLTITGAGRVSIQATQPGTP